MRLIEFIPVAALLIVVPGPDVLLVLRNAVHGKRQGLATAAGTLSGLLLHVTGAILGLSALLATSAHAFMLVKMAGAAYLAFLGVRLLLRAGRRDARAHHGRASADRQRRRGPLQAYRDGLLTNALNPKVAVFFVTLLPQFTVGAAATPRDIGVLGGVFIALTALYLLALVGFSVLAQSALSRPPVRSWLDRVSGALFLAFGGRLLAAR